MANTNAPFGLRPIRKHGGGNLELSPYKIASGYATTIGMGDPVQAVGDGTIALAEAGNVDNIGVFMGVEYTNSEGQRVWSEKWPAGTTATNIIASVIDDPMQAFEAQITTYSDALHMTLVDWVIGAPDSGKGQSKTYLDAGTSATSGKSMRVLGLVESPDNEAGAYARVVCVFAEHVFLTGAAGAGGV